ncbi:putative bifunctional diguanylate cyclase/phosphodiesterase [Sulfurimonas paralvinellae]|uniref:Bifunctional diguanylate cyclase/phosphodiesterase n=1 Tax=Sulfurimonas paralvinellae TaxID=317658 RepID=A0A7M1B503_9BACT|nr:bifunctional diguanylate cyclase/phosphodiesterase [Sulfurimonas paralvinellae]QOP44817.1 bifunctional diguanylate cyclase/phosphodiesterase [Sulfurimonas paralvinellae]
MKHLVKLYILIFITIVFSIVYLYVKLGETQDQLTINIDNIFLTQTKEIARNIDEHIHNEIDANLYAQLKNNLKLRERLEEEMSLLHTEIYQYIYILYRDKHHNFRYLLDGSKEDKGAFDEKLNVNKKIWEKVYKSKTSQLYSQQNIDALSQTYLAPIIYNDTVEAVLAIDFSTALPRNITQATIPLKHVFFYIFAAILLMLLILLYQTFLNLKTKKESITDPLTQAYNRTYLRELLKRIDISAYQIAMLDIDYFKQVNDTYGHKTGDKILRDVADIIKQEIRSNDIFVRFGGEEFLLFISKQQENNYTAKKVAERIRKHIEMTSFVYDNITIKLTLSIGITCDTTHFKSISDAIKHADKMLYIAKREGRNLVITDNKQQQKEQDKKETSIHQLSINAIKEAIEDNRVFVFFQPIFDAHTSNITKYEALIRIKDKNGTIVLPGQFLPTVAHTNVYNDLTKIVLENVFKTIEKSKMSISVNLNFSDIVDSNIFGIIIEELKANKVLASWLIIELLENEILEADATLVQHIQEIKSFGVKIAIDDFGTGYANYAVFQKLPIDIIKIDGSLIKEIDTSPVSQRIVKSIIYLTEEFNIETIAEFVHSEEVYTKVKELGITHLQGFYLAKPQEDLAL